MSFKNRYNKEIINILKEYNNRYNLINEASKLDVLINKAGLNPDVAEEFYNISKSFSVWIVKKVVEYYSQLTGQSNKEVISKLEKLGRELKSAIRSIMDYILVGLNGNNSTIKDLSFLELLAKSKDWHDSLNIGEGVLNYNEENPIIIDFRDENGLGYYWADLQTNDSPEECERMGHCGRSDYNLYSLRNYSKLPSGESTINRSVLTAAISDDGILYQLKGPNDKKPTKGYHQYILPLFYVDDTGEYLINGFGTEYDSEQDFQFSDLPVETIMELYENRPELFGLKNKYNLSRLGLIEPMNLSISYYFKTKNLDDYVDLRGHSLHDIIYVLKGQNPFHNNDWKGFLDWAVNEENLEFIEEIINKEIIESGDEINDEMSLVQKIEKYDNGVIGSLLSAADETEYDEYYNYIYYAIETALSEYGDVFELDGDDVGIVINMLGYINNLDDSAAIELQEECEDDLTCWFKTMLKDDYIDIPEVKLYSYWDPDFDTDIYNNFLNDRLIDLK